MDDTKISNHVMVKHGGSFNAVCQWVFQNSPINYIGFAKIYDDKSRSYLITDSRWGEHLLNHRYHLAGTEDAIITHTQKDHHLWSVSSMFALNQQTENLLRDCIINNYGNGVTLLERGKGFVECIHICANSGHEKPDEYLTNNIDQLWRFVLHIKEKIYNDKVLKQAYTKRYHDRLDIKKFNHSNQTNKYIKFKKYYLGGYFGDLYFTKREIMCLILLYQNKTAKEQARCLNLSYRTIEKYIEIIKYKAMVKSRGELIELLRTNRIFNYIILDPVSFLNNWGIR